MPLCRQSHSLDELRLGRLKRADETYKRAPPQARQARMVANRGGAASAPCGAHTPQNQASRDADTPLTRPGKRISGFQGQKHNICMSCRPILSTASSYVVVCPQTICWDHHCRSNVPLIEGPNKGLPLIQHFIAEPDLTPSLPG